MLQILKCVDVDGCIWLQHAMHWRIRENVNEYMSWIITSLNIVQWLDIVLGDEPAVRKSYMIVIKHNGTVCFCAAAYKMYVVVEQRLSS